MEHYSYYCALTGKKLISCPAVLLPIARRTAEHELMRCLEYFAPVALPMPCYMDDKCRALILPEDCHSKLIADHCFICAKAWDDAALDATTHPTLPKKIAKELGGKCYDTILSQMHQIGPELMAEYREHPGSSSVQFVKLIGVLWAFERVGRHVMPSMASPEH